VTVTMNKKAAQGHQINPRGFLQELEDSWGPGPPHTNTPPASPITPWVSASPISISLWALPEGIIG